MEFEKTLESLRGGLAAGANAKTVYGEPIHAGSKTVIPVARVSYGFGAGSGHGRDKGDRAGEGEGGGGGGGMKAVPVAVVEVTPEQTRVIPFNRRRKLAAAAAAGLALGWWLGRRAG
jgi:uncharacterized spore protein YtfJ